MNIRHTLSHTHTHTFTQYPACPRLTACASPAPYVNASTLNTQTENINTHHIKATVHRGSEGETLSSHFEQRSPGHFFFSSFVVCCRLRRAFFGTPRFSKLRDSDVTSLAVSCPLRTPSRRSRRHVLASVRASECCRHASSVVVHRPCCSSLLSCTVRGLPPLQQSLRLLPWRCQQFCD